MVYLLVGYGSTVVPQARLWAAQVVIRNKSSSETSRQPDRWRPDDYHYGVFIAGTINVSKS
ncbi:hypothetical protein D083_4229 [Dickeya solani RNS 08.23.3.1.A]|nr:hypothetical protein D083_4229 [Dickeya solani RNS 08.23.3.1.A]